MKVTSEKLLKFALSLKIQLDFRYENSSKIKRGKAMKKNWKQEKYKNTWENCAQTDK